MAKRRKGKGKGQSEDADTATEPAQSSDTHARAQAGSNETHEVLDTVTSYPTLPHKNVRKRRAGRASGGRSRFLQRLRSWATNQHLILATLACAAALLSAGVGWSQRQHIGPVYEGLMDLNTAAGREWFMSKLPSGTAWPEGWQMHNGTIWPDSLTFDLDSMWGGKDGNNTSLRAWLAQSFPGTTPVWLKSFLESNGTSAYERKPDRLGLQLAKRGLRAKYPIILIPGFVTSGLELWAGHECFKGARRVSQARRARAMHGAPTRMLRGGTVLAVVARDCYGGACACCVAQSN